MDGGIPVPLSVDNIYINKTITQQEVQSLVKQTRGNQIYFCWYFKTPTVPLLETLQDFVGVPQQEACIYPYTQRILVKPDLKQPQKQPTEHMPEWL